MRKALIAAVVAALGVAAGISVATGDGAHAAANADPISSYPQGPRVRGGGNPLANVPLPRDCSPTRDRGTARDYTPLSRMRQTRADNPFVVGEAFTTRLTYTNRKQQRFYIYVSAMTSAPVKAYISSSSACLERFTLKQRIPVLIEPVYFGAILVDAAVDATGSTRAKLSHERDAAGAAATLADVLTAEGVDPHVVIASAAAKADAELQAKVAAGELTAAEVDALDLEQIMTDLANQPGAPFLIDPVELPMTPTELGAMLKRDARRNVVVGMERADGKPKGPEIVWFVFDPTLAAGATQGYVAHCESYSSTRIHRWSGSHTLSFWRVTTPNPIGTRTANSTNPYPSGMSHSSTTKRTYDIKVKANSTGSYSVEGGWQAGTGGGCP